MCFKLKSTHLNAQNKTAKYFLKIKGHTHILNLAIGQDKTGKSILTSPQHQYRCLHPNHCLCLFHLLLLCQNHRFSLFYLLDMLTSSYQYIKTTVSILLIFRGALIGEWRLFRESYFLKERSLERGAY